MFEVGFQELFLLGAIALLVVGPERLPGLARTVGVWVGKAQRLVGQVRADVEREIRAEELRQSMKEFSPTAALSDMRKEVEEFAGEVSRPAAAGDRTADSGRAAESGSGEPEAAGGPRPDPAGDTRAAADPAAPAEAAEAAGTAGSERTPEAPPPRPGAASEDGSGPAAPAGVADAGPAAPSSSASMAGAAAAAAAAETGSGGPFPETAGSAPSPIERDERAAVS